MSQVQETNGIKEESEEILKYKDSTIEAYTINRRQTELVTACVRTTFQNKLLKERQKEG